MVPAQLAYEKEGLDKMASILQSEAVRARFGCLQMASAARQSYPLGAEAVDPYPPLTGET